MLIYISIVSGTTGLILLSILATMTLRHKKSSFQKDIERRRKEAIGSKGVDREVHRKLFQIYSKFPVVKQMLESLFKSLSIVGEKDDRYLMKRCVVIITGLLLSFLAFAVFFWTITNSILYTSVFLIFLWYVSDSYLDYFVTSSHTKLLKQMMEFISLVRQKYYEYGVVDDAVYEATQNLSRDAREMSVQGELIYNVFMESDRETAITSYIETAPNPYLKMFINFSLMTMEYGDSKVDESSVFLKNLSFLAKNIQLDIDKRERLNYALKSMNIIVLLPLLLISPLKNWAVSNFAPLGHFYSSPIGKYIELFTLALIIISMILLNKIQNLERKKLGRHRLSDLANKVPLNIGDINKIKWLSSCSVFLIVIGMMLGIQIQGKIALADKVYYKDTFFGGTLSEEDKDLREIESFDDYGFITSSTSSTSKFDISNYLKAIGIEDEYRVERIDEKIKLYHSYHLMWWHILAAIFFAFIAYHFPKINSYINYRLRSLDVDDEVAGFRSIVMMLMYNQRMNVEEILEWFEGYAIFYKDVIHRCLLDLSSGEREAIESMANQIQHKEMLRLTYQLGIACEDISLQEAFDELLQEKNHFFEERKWQNEKLINRKILLGQNIGFIPAYSLIILYMIIPMVVSSTNELSRFFTQVLT